MLRYILAPSCMLKKLITLSFIGFHVEFIFLSNRVFYEYIKNKAGSPVFRSLTFMRTYLREIFSISV